ncbi:19342_t:CDS:2, partial [Funneliformis geosporum]
SAFYNLVDRYAPKGVEYKKIDNNMKANIIRKVCDWVLNYLMRRKINTMRDNMHRKNKPRNDKSKKRAKNK